MNQKPTLIIVTGPTAVGKTSLSIELAEHLNSEIISCDSRQIYQELTIGTAKPSEFELNRVKHHFINHISIYQAYTAADFEREASELLNKLLGESPFAILTGGTGLYINALLHGLDDIPKIHDETKKNMHDLYEQEGVQALQKIIKKTDPHYYQQMDTNNPRRLIRAAEVIYQTGQKFSSFLGKKSKTTAYDVKYFVVNRSRESLYERINLRVDEMMKEGLLDEAKSLFKERNLRALQTVGYQELFEFIEGTYTLEEAINKIKQHSRNYAKRQLTWFRKVPNAIWLEAKNDPLQTILKELKLN